METSTIEDLAYLMAQTKKEKLPLPIVFLGAGASRTGEIPLASEIVTDILNRYKENPRVRRIPEEEKKYPKLMECLTPFERNNLLKGYIEEAKINVTHIYLAQLVTEGYVDYVLTVNFDNLMLRALALFNTFPPTYDMAILKDLTTTTPNEKSVIYLHGQHHGLWLLNTDEEMTKVKKIIPKILHPIKDRLWIFIGYSGEDPIFDQIKELGRFDKGLFWVSYYDDKPSETVCRELLEKDNTNSFLIKGFDADSFMLKLNSELKLPQPVIIDKPFSALKTSLENIVDIEDKEHFKGVKERLEIVIKQVDTAIEQFEEAKIKPAAGLQKEESRNLLKKQIIDKIIKGEFKENEINALVEKANKLKAPEVFNLLSGLYSNWGNAIFVSAKHENDEALYLQSFEKYAHAAEINPKADNVFYNWGNVISALAKLKNDEALYLQSFEKYSHAAMLNPKNDTVFDNWGTAISALAKLKNDEDLYRQSFEKYAHAAELNPKSDTVFNNWGNAILELAKLKNDEALYRQSIEKYAQAAGLNPKDYTVFYNFGTAILDLAKLKNDEALYRQSVEKLKEAVELGGSCYNLACAYALQNEKSNALEYLEKSLAKKEIAVEFVEKDEDWKAYINDIEFKTLLNKYRSFTAV